MNVRGKIREGIGIGFRDRIDEHRQTQTDMAREF
jgi:hypothetical protein